MTAETLKPFITLPTGSTYNTKRTTNFRVLSIGFSIFLIVFCTTLLGFTIWNSIRATALQKELDDVKKIIDNVQKRLGLDFLEDLNEFEEAYDSKTFDELDDPDNDRDDWLNSFENDDDEYDDDTEFDEMDSEEIGSGLIDDLTFDREEKLLNRALFAKRFGRNVEKTRIPRSIATIKGTAVLEEQDPSLNRANKSLSLSVLQNPITTRPTLKDDWTDKKKHKKHLESRAQPEIYVRIPARDGHQQPISTKRKQIVITGSRRREIRQKSLGGRTRQIQRSRSIAVHYVGDTSQYAVGRHENFDGNGRLRHQGVYTDWVTDAWAESLDMKRFFKMENGVVTIRENGIYYVYAQIFYHDDHDTNGFVMEKNQQDFIQCTAMTYSTQRVTKSNTCFTGGVTHLKIGDTLRISNLGNNRYTVLEPSKSFFGVVKLGEAPKITTSLHHTSSEEESEPIRRSIPEDSYRIPHRQQHIGKTTPTRFD